jgi:DNA-binding response OmpR family regulator
MSVSFASGLAGSSPADDRLWPPTESQDAESHRDAIGGTRQRPLILAIDHDPGTLEIVGWALSLAGFDVACAHSGAEGLALASMNRFDLALVDLRLPDMLGTDVIRRLREGTSELRFVLVSGFLTTAVTVEAMKLGAVDVIEKPVMIDDLVRVVCGGLEEATADTGSESREGSYCLTTTTATRGTPRIGRPGSVAERWARLVLKVCESPGDLRTLEDWATFAGVSYSSLRESCHLIGIQPHDARDLARVVRAVVRARRIGCSPEVLLDVSDSRTLSKLLARAGLGGDVRARGMTAAQLLDAQRFVPAHNAGLRVLALLLARAG